MSDLDVEILGYQIRYPYISNQALEEPDGNAILYLGVFLAIKRRYEDMGPGDAALVQETYNFSVKEPGLLTRGRHKFEDRQAHDDYYGMIFAAHITGQFKIVSEIYGYGKKHFWFYDNVGTTGFDKIRTFFGRFPGFVANLKLAHRVKLSLWDQLLWAISVVGFSSESGIQMNFLMCEVYRTQPYNYWLLDKAVKQFEAKIAKQYPNLMGSVFQAYYDRHRDYNKPPKHIFARWMQGRQ